MCNSRVAVSLHIRRVRVLDLPVTQKGGWVFLELTTNDGLIGISEISQTGNDALAIDLIRTRFGPAFVGASLQSARTHLRRLNVARGRDLVFDTVLSGLDTALSDLENRANGVSLGAGIGATLPGAELVPLYANINRSIGSRSPEHFARVAVEAVEAGFTAVKCAPFDEFRWSPSESSAANGDITPGLQRVRAIRAAIGPSVVLLVDCHKRLSLDAALIASEVFADCAVGWLEEPFPISAVGLYDQLRRQVPLTVAGGEDITSFRGFRRFVASEQADIVMPDIKYCGLHIARGAARLAGRAQRRASLHSPSGPVSTLASGHLTATLSNALYLEYAYGEVPWRSEVIVPSEVIEHGALRLPKGAGIGATLNLHPRGPLSSRIQIASDLRK